MRCLRRRSRQLRQRYQSHHHCSIESLIGNCPG
jgi:hypothetical protein